MATQLEIYHLRLINSARANPAGMAESLGIDLNEGLDPGTISSAPKPPLAINTVLGTMATAHSQDMLDNDFFSHTSPTSGTTGDRFLAANYDTIFYGENLGLITSSINIDDYVAAKTMFDSLFIDEGVSGRGHRLSILSTSYKEVGIGHLEGDYDGDAYSHLLTIDFGLESASKSFVVGCLYDDTNENAEYDVGEGISGITVNAEIGGVVQETTTTDSFGYYSLELDYGTFDIVAETSGHDSVWNAVEIDVSNVAIDLLWDSVITDRPAGGFSSNSDLVQFNDMQSIFDALQPVNVQNETPDEYILNWSISDATKVYLDNEEVTAIGARTFYATSVTSHTLRSVGPAGITELRIDINVSVIIPFKTEGKLLSGLDALYGPSHEQSMRIS